MWLELRKDYDMSFPYHHGKANAIADALRRFCMENTAHVKDEKTDLSKYVHTHARLGVIIMDSTKEGILVNNGVESSLPSKVKEKQDKDPILLDSMANVQKKIVLDFEQV